jgi:plasmid stabilization system protein ParE
MTYRFHLLAKWDLIDLVDRYNVRHQDLGDVFEQQVENKVRELTAHPRQFWIVQPPVRGHEIRQAIVEHFPFFIIYEVLTTEVVVVAIVHFRQRRRTWRRRL